MNKQNPIFLHLNLATFKTQACKNSRSHQVKQCNGYHFDNERRRSLMEFNYVKSLCKNRQRCRKGDSCSFAHNFIEQVYHPDNYKKKYCKDFIEQRECKFGRFCALAHSDQELKIKPLHIMKVDTDFLLFHLKTEFCPFSRIKHDRFSCVYAHNW